MYLRFEELITVGEVPRRRKQRSARFGMAGKTLCAVVFLLTTVVDRVAAQTINLSRDLVTLGIASQNLPSNNPAFDARPLFQAAFEYAQSHPVKALTVDKGSYYLLTPKQSNVVLVIPLLSNVVIDLAGSTLYFNVPLLNSGIQVYYSSNITLTNFQTDYVTPPYTHVRITSVDAVNQVIRYETLAGWRDPATFSSLVDPYGGSVQFWVAFFRNGQIVPGTSRTEISVPASSALRVIQNPAPWTQSATLSTLQTGDTMVVAARAGGPPIEVWHSDGITLSNISVYGAGQYAVNLWETSNSLVDHVNVVPRPGMGLIGSNADGIHFSSVGRNNRIRNCYISRIMDDALIMDSVSLASVSASTATRQLTVTRGGLSRFSNGTPVNFVDPASGAEIDGATILSQTPADSASPRGGEQIVLTFDRDLPPVKTGFAMVFASADQRGNGSIIEDNIVNQTFCCHGIAIFGAVGVTIQRNVIRNASMAGIDIDQLTDTSVVPPAKDITITDNVLEGVLSPAANGGGSLSSLAAIQVVTITPPQFSFGSSAPNKNIVIRNNYIADSGRSGIWIGELDGGAIQNNQVIRWNQHPELGINGIQPIFQPQVLSDFKSPIVIRYSSSVVQTGNITSATSGATAPVIASPSGATFSAAPASGAFLLQTLIDGFSWKAVSDSPWLTILAASTGSGAGVLKYSLTANDSGTPRTGIITIAGEVFTVQQTTAVLPGPAIDKGGISPIYSSSPTIEPGSWISIFGKSLSQTTRTWDASTEVVNGNLPVSLDNVSVLVDGRPASMYYISPSQINVQAPDSSVTGTVNVVVLNSGGASNPEIVTLGATGPSLFTYGDRYAIGVIPVSSGYYGPGVYDLMGPAGRYSFNTRPAKPGDIVALYGTGFGGTLPPTPAGKVVNPPYGQVATPVVITIGGISQTVNAYVTGAGLWQMNVIVPNLPASDYSLGAAAGGIQSPTNILISIQ